MKHTRGLWLGLLLALISANLFLSRQAVHANEPDFEVWAIDQSGPGGTLYIYDDDDLTIGKAATAVPEAINLAGAAVDTACDPGNTGNNAVRPHMMFFNADNTHVIIAFVATGHVLFMDAATRTPVTCIDVGTQAHAAFPAPDQSYVIVANQNGKLLQRINTDVDGDSVPYEDAADIALDGAATLNLATCTTPNGVPCQDPAPLQAASAVAVDTSPSDVCVSHGSVVASSSAVRPDNAPICPVIDATSRLVFVTLRGGGLFVVDGTTTPMSIVAEYDLATVQPNGCGGLEKGGKMYVNSGGGTVANPTTSDVYAFALSQYPASGFNPPNTPAPTVIFSKAGDHDSHGMLLNSARDSRYIWAADRFSSAIEVVDTLNDELVNTFSLIGKASADPTPDLIDISPNGRRAFVALRGPCPLTGNAPGTNNAVGATPGVGVINIHNGGRFGKLVAVAPITNAAPGGFDCPTRTDDVPGSITNQGDPHGLRVRVK